MNPIPLLFNQHQINMTVLGGKESVPNIKMNISAVIINKGWSTYRSKMIENLMRCGFSEIITIEADSENYSIEDFSRKFPFVKIVIPLEESTEGDLINIGSDIAGTSYDAATANWGSPWRMPSLTQIKELVNSCTSTWTTQNGVNGRKFVGPNGGTIFLPAAGDRWGGELLRAGRYGYYWSSALYESGPYYAWNLYFNSEGVYMGYDNGYDGRDDGRTVRPVR